MSESNNDGGSAFPSTLWDTTESGTTPREYYPGMSLRDYFAAKAMAGLYSDPAAMEICVKAAAKYFGGSLALAVATGAYRTADAMLKVRDLRG